MLKITLHDSSTSFRIRLEGKLTAPWVTELENCWRSARSATGAKPIEVDLAGVDYVDLAGKYLLELMHAYGAELVAPTLPLQSTVQEIRTASRGVIARSVLLVSLLVASVVHASAEPVRLTLDRAVKIATSPEGSARLQIAHELVKQANARSAEARGALLPDFDAVVGQQNQTRNLAAMGIRFNTPIPGFQIPTFVGPFNTFDVRANLRQNIFDFSSIRRYQSARTAAGSVRSELGNTEQQVMAAVARAYVAALKADADVESAEANAALARSVLDLVQSQKAAGTGTGIEVTRARVQLANEEQRLLVTRNERRRARLQLLRTIGMRLDTEIELDGKLIYMPPDLITLEQARARAVERRPDWKAQQQREESIRLASSATALERLPSVAGFADYGSIGTSINNALPTRTYGISVRVPIFDGGRKDARRAEAGSQFRQEQARTRDLRDQIDLEIQLALDAVVSADEQVKVAAEGLKLADTELQQAERRYKAGVATSIEVTDAQTRLERARDNQVTALFAYNVARIDLAVAQGSVEDIIH